MDCYNFSKGSFYFNLFQDFNKFFREMYTSEDSNALFSQYSEKFIQFYPGDFSFDLLFALGRVTEQKTWKTISLEQYVDFFKEYYVLFRNMLGRVLTSYQSSESFCKMAYDGLEALWQKYRGIQTEKWQFGVDMLAAGIGNIHGKYPANWKGLSFETLDAIQQKTGVMPLVLHGGTGIPADMIKKAISLGVSKINVNTECQLSFADATRKYIEAGKDLEGKGFDPRKLLAPGFEAIKATVKEKMELFGSVGKAND